MWTPDSNSIFTAEERNRKVYEETIEYFRINIQNYVDSVAKSRRYDNGNSLASYVASTIPSWAAEAQIFVSWRDAVWTYVYGELEKVEQGMRTQPTLEEFLAELPVIIWPE